MIDLLHAILGERGQSSSGNAIDWNDIQHAWSQRLPLNPLSKGSLKSKWQALSKLVSSDSLQMGRSLGGTPGSIGCLTTAPAPSTSFTSQPSSGSSSLRSIAGFTNAPAPSTSSSSQHSSESSAHGSIAGFTTALPATSLSSQHSSGSRAPQSIAPSVLPVPRAVSPLDSSNYTSSQIDDVELTAAPPGTRFSDAELEVFAYILLTKLQWTAGKSLKWGTFESYWKTVAKIAKLNDKFAAVYSRSRDQLEQKWKDTEKIKYNKK